MPELLANDKKQQHRRYTKKKKKAEQEEPSPRTVYYVEQSFRIIKALGHVAFGEVLHVVSIDDGQQQEVALKRTRPPIVHQRRRQTQAITRGAKPRSHTCPCEHRATAQGI
jgi:hypothetical protein